MIGLAVGLLLCLTAAVVAVARTKKLNNMRKAKSYLKDPFLVLGSATLNPGLEQASHSDQAVASALASEAEISRDTVFGANSDNGVRIQLLATGRQEPKEPSNLMQVERSSVTSAGLIMDHALY